MRDLAKAFMMIEKLLYMKESRIKKILEEHFFYKIGGKEEDYFNFVIKDIFENIKEDYVKFI